VRTAIRWRLLALSAAGALGGLLLFHLFIMPRFVRHGEETIVPGLRGTPGGAAAERLHDAGLRTGRATRVHDDEIEMGRVVRQAPPAGARVKRGREVDLVISLGAEARQVPALEGESVTHARFLLGQSGLREGRRRSVHVPDVGAERIVAANPRPGTPVQDRTGVDLLVSAGPAPRGYLMPDLRGMPADEAARILEAAGLEVVLRARGRRQERVQGQEPPPGARVATGDPVDLRTGR
jgi:serine/threonine-protein kinase